MTNTTHQSNAAATDVAEFITDLDGGMFDRKLSIALSQVAAATVDHGRVGKVSIELSFEKIPGTSQVQCKHTLKFTRPTMDGEASEKENRSTALHVGKFGKLSLAPENQMAFLDRQGNPTAA
jgi:hypothetical protein